jgi:hypothetical protein
MECMSDSTCGNPSPSWCRLSDWTMFSTRGSSGRVEIRDSNFYLCLYVHQDREQKGTPFTIVHCKRDLVAVTFYFIYLIHETMPSIPKGYAT